MNNGRKASLKTTDHEIIKKWIEDRNGKPTVVDGTQDKGDGAGLLRIDFEGFSGEDTLVEISWEEFFRTFELKSLAFLYDDDPDSRFFKFIKRESMNNND
jgi:hypothetical protein